MPGGAKIRRNDRTGQLMRQQYNSANDVRTLVSDDNGETWEEADVVSGTPATPEPSPPGMMVDPGDSGMLMPELSVPRPEPKPEPKPSLGESILRGIGQGTTLGWGEEAAAMVLDALPKPEGYGVREGTEGAALSMMRDDNRRAQEAHPYGYGGGQVLGAMPAAVGGAQALGLNALRGLPAVAAGAAEGAVVGGIEGAGMAEEGSRGEGAMTGGAMGAAGGAAGPLLTGTARGAAGPLLTGTARGLARVPGRIARGAKSVADRQRAAATGAYGGQLKKLARDRGAEAVEEFGADVERLGMHKAPEGSALPQTWETYADNASRIKGEAGNRIGELSDMADSNGVQVNLREIAEDLLDDAVELAKLPDPTARAQADELFSKALEFEQRGSVSYSEAHSLRRFLDDIAYDAEAARQSQIAQRAKKLAGKIRGGMSGALQEADPALQEAMAAANKDYSTATRVATYAEGRIAQEAGNQAVSLPAMVSGAGGLAHSGPIGAAGAMAGGQLMKTRGHGAAAAGARGIQRGAELAQRVGPELAQRVGPAIPTPRAGSTLSELTNAPAVHALSTAAGATAGGEQAASMPEHIQQVALSNPQALGPFGPVLARAADEGEFAMVYDILQDKPEFLELLAAESQRLTETQI